MPTLTETPVATTVLHAEVAQQLVELGGVERGDAVEAVDARSRRRAAPARRPRPAAASRAAAARPCGPAPAAGSWPSQPRRIGAPRDGQIEDRHLRRARRVEHARDVRDRCRAAAPPRRARRAPPPPPTMPSWHSITSTAVRGTGCEIDGIGSQSERLTGSVRSDRSGVPDQRVHVRRRCRRGCASCVASLRSLRSAMSFTVSGNAQSQW